MSASPIDRGAPSRLFARGAVVGLGVFLAATLPLGAQRAPSSRPLTELSLEELMQIEVTTVSKHREKLTDAPAAVFALNADDVQRAGVTSFPDALRLVPGMQVGQVTAHDWAISARGFAETFSNKLLVLRDGRSVYTPLFSGVFWDAQEMLLDDLEHIEVVRGPGATLWGANAVNGVINILSKPARETQGSFAAVSAGSDPEFSTRARYGGVIDARTHFRVYGKYTRHDSLPALGGGDGGDSWHLGQTGFRVDRDDEAGNTITVQGDAYRGEAKQIFLLPTALPPFMASLPAESPFKGANLLGRLTHRFTGGDELQVQGFVDYTGRDTPIFAESRRTFDLEAQQRLRLKNHEVTFGGAYRFTGDRVRNSPYVALNPARRGVDLWSAFVQDDIALSEHTRLTLGSKLEHNDSTGWEVQPGGRLLWQASERHTFWGSIARAVRTPSRSEDDVRFYLLTGTPGISSVVLGNRAFDSEKLTAYEAGWRFHAREKLSVDFALFVNSYRQLRTSELTPASLFALAQLSNPNPAAPPPFPLTLVGASHNKMRGETSGGEITLVAQLAPGWRIRSAYSHLRISLRVDPTSTDLGAKSPEGRSPRHQAYVWSQHDLSKSWKFDWTVRGVDRLRDSGIAAYVAVDARVAWRAAERWEVSVSGRNLTDPQHPEFFPQGVFTPPAESARSVQVEVKYGF